MKTIQIYENKTLKLQDRLMLFIDFESRDFMIDMEIERMQTYIATHGTKRIGPLIQHVVFESNQQGVPIIGIKYMLQTEEKLSIVEQPYQVEDACKVANCLYARYIGPEDGIKFAYDKLGVYAFENEINLQGGSYTIYVDKNEDEESITADIFMPTKVG